MAHVHVTQENRDVGRTNSSGRLLVPDMRSFDLNHVEIDPADIPAEVSINNVKREFRPQDRSGVVVKFPIKFSHAALLHLVDDAGRRCSWAAQQPCGPPALSFRLDTTARPTLKISARTTNSQSSGRTGGAAL